MSSTDKTINLEVNGRIFPSWVIKNFKKFTLPEIIRKAGEDPCNEKLKFELNTYQRFIGQFLNYRSPFSDMLVFHGVGSGKTVSAINVYNVLFNFTPKWNVFLLIPASLRNDPWLKDLNNWIEKSDKDLRMKNIQFVHYDSPYADRDFLEKIKKVDSSKGTLYIFDEAHNFIRNVYNNISSKKGKRAQVIYDYIQQEKKEEANIRILMLTATPVVNIPFEFALYFNLMRPGSFPESEALFNQLYISSTNYQSLNDETKNMFQRRIMGLVSYYIGATPDKFAQKTIHYKNIVMEKYFEEIYNHFEKIEEEKEKIRRKMSRGKVGGDEMSTYSSYTRQACNFVFPRVGNKINGEDRPRPGKFRIKEEDAEKIDENKNAEATGILKRSKEEVQAYVKAITDYINTFIEYLKDQHREDKSKNHTLQNDVDNFYKKYKGSFSDFYSDSSNKKSKLFEAMYTSSPKFIQIIFNIFKSAGPVLVYSNYVATEGLQIFKVYLSFFGFISYENDKEIDPSNLGKKNPKDGFRYIEFHGGVDKDLREANKAIYNMSENKFGNIIKIIMISPAGTEGINLRNTRQVHITEPYWNEVRVEQIIGRAIRICSHADIPMNDRHVDVFRYKMVRSSKKETTDERMESIARKKNNLLISFTEAVKEGATDCEIFKSHNMMGTKYKCFKFNENSLLETPIGPAYTPKIEYDKKMDDGSNSKDSYRQKIKVMKIKAVKKIGDNSYSESNDYWYFKDTGIVYDFDSDYPIGKVDKDDGGNEIKLDNETYIITTLIDIPEFKLYD
jgi:superfamily II DNA or RNA helicase